MACRANFINVYGKTKQEQGVSIYGNLKVANSLFSIKKYNKENLFVGTLIS